MFKKVKLKLDRFRSDDFVRGAGVLAGGTIVGRFIGFLFLPLITRFYSPEDYSALAFYLGLLTIFGAISSLRFEIAIPVPADDSKAINLLLLATASALTITTLLFFVAKLASSGFFGDLAPPRFEPYWFMLPLGVLFFALYSILQYWSARRKQFRSIAITRITQSLIGGSTASILGLFSVAPFGLFLGNMLNTSAGMYRLAREFISADRQLIKNVKLRDVYKTAIEFRRYPLFSTVESLANAAGSQLPLVIIASIAVGGDSGSLLLASQVMLAPMSLIGMSISKVYLVKGAESYRNNELKELTMNVQLKLVKLGVGPIILIGSAAPMFFPILFGSRWERAGVFISWMTPWVVLQFLSSPVSSCFHLAERQKAAMGLQIGGFVLRVGSILVAAFFFGGLQAESFIFSSFIFYLIFLIAEYSILNISFSDFLKIIRKSSLYVLPYVLIALLINSYSFLCSFSNRV